MDPQAYVVPAAGRLAPLREAWRRRGVFWSLALREIQVRYRQAWLGIGWALIQPLALTAVATLVFHRFLALDSRGAPYPVFVFTGLFVWTFFHTAVSAAVPSLVSNASLVRKIWFPREALPLGAVAAAGLDLVAASAVWLVLVALDGGYVGAAVLHLPPLLALLFVATTGPALLGAALNVHYRDVKHALPLLLQAVFFATPIVYALDVVPPPWRGIVALNPLAVVVEGLRLSAFEGRGPAFELWWPGTAVAVFVLLFAYLAFQAAGRRFADVV